ncbi:hypothetical protein [Maribacter luteus]|uniref:hypothetical protein n=1 Tax=Maribacter luteus TaxID=2594478 RepID=UPI00249216E7|nr:hypothetical protein [Maribacter luteus]
MTLENKDFQLVALAGYGQRLAKIPDGFDSDVNDYLKSLRRGLVLSVEGNYYFNDTWGTGLKYSFFSSNKDFSSSGFGPFIRDEIQIHYVAPQVLVRTVSKNGKHMFISALGIGYTVYNDDVFADQQEINLTGNSIAFNTDIGYEFQFNDYAAFVIRVGLTSGSLNKLTSKGENGSQTIELEGDDRESLTRLDFMGGFRIKL